MPVKRDAPVTSTSSASFDAVCRSRVAPGAKGELRRDRERGTSTDANESFAARDCSYLKGNSRSVHPCVLKKERGGWDAEPRCRHCVCGVFVYMHMHTCRESSCHNKLINKTDTPNKGWEKDRVPTCASRIL